MKYLTRVWFSPHIPLMIMLLVGNGEPYNALPRSVIDGFFIVMVLVFFFLFIGRAIIRYQSEGLSFSLLFSIDFLAIYGTLTWIFWDKVMNYPTHSVFSSSVLLISLVCALTVCYRYCPWPFRFIMEMIFGAGSYVVRPDILSQKKNIQHVSSALSLTDEGVFCGTVKEGRVNHSLYVSAEDRGVVIGPPGTGKTAFMVTQLLDRVERGGSFVCLDIKPELHTIMREKLEAQGYRVLVFNPTNKVDRYNLLDDLSGLTAIGELAYSLIPSSGEEGKAFDEGARDLLDGIISYLRFEKKQVSLPAIRDFLAQFSSEDDLIAILSECEDSDVKDTAFAIARSAKNARFMGSVFATLRSNLRFLRYADIRDSIEQSDFSLSCFLEDQPVALFLQFEERHQETTQLLLSATISHLMNYFIEHVGRAPVLLMFDEIGNVPKIPGLVEKLNTIRSRKLPTWMYWQGIQQMQKYGKQANEGPNSIMAACDFHMAFRLNDNDTARWFSERIGTVDRVSVSSTSSEHSSTSTSTTEEPILKVADLQSLPIGESVVVYRGKAWRNHATPYFERWPEMARDE